MIRTGGGVPMPLGCVDRLRLMWWLAPGRWAREDGDLDYYYSHVNIE